MHIDMNDYKIEDLKNEADREFLQGHRYSIHLLDIALGNYLNECSMEDTSIPAFEKLRASILKKFVGYAKDYIKSENDLLLVDALDKQACEEEHNDN